MRGEGLTLEEVELVLSAYDLDPNLGNHVNEPTRGDWMLARDSLLREGYQGVVVEQPFFTHELVDPSAAPGDFPDRES